VLGSHKRCEKLKLTEPNLTVEVEDMTVVKIIELIGSSPISWEAAAANAGATVNQSPNINRKGKLYRISLFT